MKVDGMVWKAMYIKRGDLHGGQDSISLTVQESERPYEL